MKKPTMHIWPVQLEDGWSATFVEVEILSPNNNRKWDVTYWDLDTLFTFISSGKVRSAYQDIIMHARPNDTLARWTQA